jgi:membrane protease YdiL (CAAX protease family)
LNSKYNSFTAPWTVRITIPILIIYLLLILPAKNIFFYNNPFLFKHIDNIYFFSIILFAFNKLNANLIGFSTKRIKTDLLIGSLFGGSILFILFILNLSIDLIGWGANDLFSSQLATKSHTYLNSPINYAVILLVIPFIEQVFFTGIIFQSLLKKINPILAIYSSGIVYSLVDYKLSLGTFGLGVVTSFLFNKTKSIYAPTIFHVSCVVGGEIIKSIYPRLKILLNFLY